MFNIDVTYLQVASGMEIEDYRAANPKIHEVPFNSSNKWQMSIHSMQYMGGKQLLLLKVLFILFNYLFNCLFHYFFNHFFDYFFYYLFKCLFNCY